MAVNKVDLNGGIVLDLTADTVTPEALDVGVTAHDARGIKIVGTRAPSATWYEGTEAPSNTLGNNNDLYLQNPPEV